MKIGIVGAGIAGLAAARELAKRDHSVVVFEKSKGLGGRCATRRVGDFTFDTGATSIAPRGKSLERVMLEELDTSDLVKIELPIFIHESLRVTAGDSAKNGVPRFTYRAGNSQLAKLLASGLDVRRESLVEGLEKDSSGRYRILDEAFDALVLTPPIPQTRELLASIGEFRPLQSVTYRMCLSVLLGYGAPTPQVKYHALVEPEQRHPLTWLSLESAKAPGRAPEGKCAIVAQLSPQFSAARYDNDDESIINATIQFVERLYGENWANPEVADVKRWRYSQPEMTAMFDSVNRPGARIQIASDGVMGARVENAYEAGILAARRLLETP